MQAVLKSLENFPSSDINLLTPEATHLQRQSLIYSIAVKVVEKLKVTSIDNMDGEHNYNSRVQISLEINALIVKEATGIGVKDKIELLVLDFHKNEINLQLF